MKHFKPFKESQSVAILRPPKGVHEGNKALYDLRANKQTLCNILVANCMARLNHSDNWEKHDLMDVLKLGDKIYCGITVDKLKQVKDEFKVEWDHLVDAGISIGNNRFSIGEIVRKDGAVVAKPVEPEEPTDTASMTADGPVDVGPKGDETGSKEEGGSTRQSDVEEPPPPDLKSILEEWDRTSNNETVLETPCFTVGIWKQDHMYFLFDPKACDEEAGLTPKRINAYEREIRQRKKEEAEAAERERAAAQSRTSQVSKTSAEKAAANKALSDVPEKAAIETAEEEENPEEAADESPSLEDLSDTEEIKDATCVLMRFTELTELIDYVRDLIPEMYHEETIVLVQPKIDYQPIISSPVVVPHRFTRIDLPNTKPFQIIRASMSQNDQIFPWPTNRNRQDAPISITTLSMATYCKGDDWTSVILDVILKYGDRLHTKSLGQIKSSNVADKLTLNQVITPFVLSHVKFSFTVQFFASGDLTVPSGNKSIKSVFDVLTDFCASKEVVYGVLVARQYHVAVWCDGKSFLMFDSHEVGPDGKRSAVGVACLYCFDDLQTMADIFLGNLDPSCDFNCFQLYKVTTNTRFHINGF